MLQASKLEYKKARKALKAARKEAKVARKAAEALREMLAKSEKKVKKRQAPASSARGGATAKSPRARSAKSPMRRRPASDTVPSILPPPDLATAEGPAEASM
jgi:hypothetical protein